MEIGVIRLVNNIFFLYKMLAERSLLKSSSSMSSDLIYVSALREFFAEGQDKFLESISQKSPSYAFKSVQCLAKV